MQCRFQQWRPQFYDWYISCFRFESFPNNSKNIIACLYIHISLCYSLTYYINVLSVASSHFLSLLSKVWYHRTDNYAYFCVINGNPASVGGYNQVVQWCGHHMMAHLWRLSLSFILSLFGFILSIGLVFEIVRIIVLVFEIV